MNPIPNWIITILLFLALHAGGCASTGSGKAHQDLLPVRCLDKPKPASFSGTKAGYYYYYYDYRDNRCKPSRDGNGQVPTSFMTLAECRAVCGADP